MPFFKPRTPLTLTVATLFAGCAIPATASLISSTVVSPTVNTGVAGQLVTTGTPGSNFAEAVTDYGINKSFASSNSAATFMQATSDWGVDFMLSGNGLNPGTHVPLIIQYMYDATLTLNNSTSNAAYSFRIGPNAGGQNQDIFRSRSNTYGSGFQDQCEDRFPLGGDHAPGSCAGGFSGSGFVTDPYSVIGSNFLESLLVVNTANGTADSFNTALILGIVVPDGITWTYGTGITGNPLNFQYAASGVPEPSTWGTMLSGGLALMLLARKRAR